MAAIDKLTAVADGARALNHSTQALTLDGITGILQDEHSAVQLALAALESRGITLPQNASAQHLADLIASIPAASQGGVRMEIGSYTVAERFKGQLILSHSMGVRPFLTLCVIHADSEVNTTVGYHRMIGSFRWYGVGSLACAIHQSNGTRFSHVGSSQMVQNPNSATQFYLPYCTANYSDFYWCEGDTFDWIIIGEEESA